MFTDFAPKKKSGKIMEKSRIEGGLKKSKKIQANLKFPGNLEYFSSEISAEMKEGRGNGRKGGDKKKVITWKSVTRVFQLVV